MIEIQNIKNSSKDDIVNLLLEEKTQQFEIYLPKETVLFHSSNDEIANDYATLAYAGQMLKHASDSFEYDYVPPSEHLSVCFRCVAKDFEKLASAIFEISLWFFNDFEEEEFYLDEAYQFIDDVKKSKLESACNDFVKDCITYIELD